MTELELFNAAIKLTPDQRSAFLATACGNDAALREQVEGLLKAHFDSATFLHESDDQPPDRRMTETIAPAEPTEHTGTMIAGRYKLIEAIGEGGMGSVWLAEQKEPVRRKVAIKLIKAGMDSKSVLARFEAERQALALMDHPNIAKVFDGGMTEQGRPYFVMEFVKGVPLTEYCDQARLSLKERLHLFVPVCQAVQHAHQKGIIHRDLKPSNILICLYDGKPVPKVIDFGLAKAMYQSLTDQSLHTAFGMMIGTPLYMSPEQAEHNNLDVDTRTDIYSLGVILYELLTGSTPLEKLQLKEAAFNEILRLIKEVEPQKPSTRLSGSLSLPSIAAQRSIEPNQLKKSLIGDLDWIVMKALDKERSRRYETANGLTRDIDRFLNDEAVEACPPSATYRLKKLLRRNKGAVAAMSAIAATLLLASCVSVWFGLSEARQRAETEKQKVEAVKQADIAETNAIEARKQQALAEANAAAAVKAREQSGLIAEFMRETLRGVDPSVARGRDITMLKEMMDAAAARIEKGNLASTPEAEIDLRGTIGNTYANLAVFDAAQQMLEPAVALARSTYAGDHKVTASALNNLALLLQERGELAKAEPLCREALEMKMRLFPDDHRDVAIGLNNLALLLQQRGELAKAESLYRDALEMKKRLFTGDHPDVATGLHNLAHLLQARGDLTGAESLFRESLEMRKRLFTGDHPGVATGLSSLALLLQTRGDLTGAEPLRREALEMTKRLFPGDHPQVATGLNNLALLLHARGDLTGAEALSREVLEMRKRLFPGDHPDVARGLGNLASLRQFRGDLAESEPLYRESLEMVHRLFPGDHPDVATGLNNLATVLQARGDLAEAEPLHREALEMTKRLFPGDHPDVAKGLGNLATLLKARGDLAEAEPLYRESLEMTKRFFPRDHPDVLSSLNNLAVLYWEQGKLDLSVPLFEEILKMRETKHGRQHPDTLKTIGDLGVNYRDAGRLEEAIPLLEEACEASKRVPSLSLVGTQLLDAYTRAVDPAKPDSIARIVPLTQKLLADARDTLPKDSPELAGQLAAFSMALLKLKAWDEAEPLIRESLTIRKAKEPDEWRTFNIESMLGGALLGQKKFAEAEPLLLAGYKGLKQRETTIPPQGIVRLPEALERLVQLYTDWHAAEPENGYDTKAAEWQTKLNDFKTAATAETPPPADKAKQP